MKRTLKNNRVKLDELLHVADFPSDFECYYKGKHILINPPSGDFAIVTWGSNSLDEMECGSMNEIFDIPIMDNKSLRQMADAGELTWS